MNKIALVTGGSRGLGKDMCFTLASKGFDVMLTYNSNEAEANAVVEAITKQGRQAVAFQLNTSEITGFPAFFQKVGEYLQSRGGNGRFDALVNNAGTALYAPFAETTEEQFDNIMNIHYKGVYFLTQQALPLLQDGGRIINVSSGLARFSQPGSSAYGSAKGAVEVLTRYLAKELGARGITVNVVAPGPVATDFGGGRVRDNKEINDHLSAQTALGRVGLADDIGGVVAFLCSEDAKWVTGQRIEASGGIFL